MLQTDYNLAKSTVVPTKSDSDVIICLQLLSKTLTCTVLPSKSDSDDTFCSHCYQELVIDKSRVY